MIPKFIKTCKKPGAKELPAEVQPRLFKLIRFDLIIYFLAIIMFTVEIPVPKTTKVY
jgi:hypothetical protein